MPFSFDQVNNYAGSFFLEIPTSYVTKNPSLLRDLNEITRRIIHNFDQPGITKWEFNNYSSALKGVLKLQECKYPFRLTGDNDILFMEVRE